MSYKLEDVISLKAWQRAMWIGFVIIAFFVVGAGIVFLFSLLIDWEMKARIIVALLMGPLVGTILGIVYYVARRPKISTLPSLPEKSDEPDQQV
jgi:phosphate/sulfate permease